MVQRFVHRHPSLIYCNHVVRLTRLLVQEKRADVVAKCVSTEPKHGEVWQSVAKDPANARKSTEEILKIVANRLTQ